MTRSRIFSETVANVLGTPIVAGGESATLMGAARMTVEGLGLALPVDPGRDTIEPDRTITVEFEDLYEQWLERAAALGKWTL
jgi:sugar (pentulose or hexulose) kinase